VNRQRVPFFRLVPHAESRPSIGRSTTAIAVAIAMCLVAAAAAQVTVLPSEPSSGAPSDRATGEWPADGVPLLEATVIGGVVRATRSAVVQDAVWDLVVRGELGSPAHGDTIDTAAGERVWRRIGSATGEFSAPELRGGYAYAVVESEVERVVILAASGHGMVMVNGEPRVGDPYATGIVRVPIALRAGRNELLFHVGRGRLTARLHDAPAQPVLRPELDDTLPDLLAGRAVDAWGAMLVMNPTSSIRRDLVVVTQLDDGIRLEQSAGTLLAHGIRKAPFRIVGPAADGPTRNLRVELRDADGALFDEATVTLRVVDEHALRIETFFSVIDDSVQHFAVRPARRESTAEDESDRSRPSGRPGMILSLHGAAVEARNHASAYAAQDFAHVVAPTNRRPFGFDWEDWGRLDALEVLAIARQRLGVPASRVWLTGHSMGGHGAWHIGVTASDRFAAVAPIASWPTFNSYGGGPPFPPGDDDSGPGELLRRAASGSDTFAMLPNLSEVGVFVLHGDADSTVSVSLARLMRTRLAEFHADFVYHEHSGGGHWWGNSSVDWPAIMQFFDARTKRDDDSVDRIEFRTVFPGLGARHRWITIVQQAHSMRTSSIDIERTVDRESGGGSMNATTENIRRLAIDLARFDREAALTLAIDGSIIELERIADHLSSGSILHLARSPLDGADGRWSIAEPPSAMEKQPRRSGQFRDGFRNRVLFVIGTIGDEIEQQQQMALARYHAETFWYRGNGAIETITDADYLRNRIAYEGRSVVLYGHRESNRSWRWLLGDTETMEPFDVARRHVRIGNGETGDESALLLLTRPHPHDETATVSVIAATDAESGRLAIRIPIFVSGVGLPDATILSPRMLREGDGGILAAGWFGNDWAAESGEWSWSPESDRPQ